MKKKEETQQLFSVEFAYLAADRALQAAMAISQMLYLQAFVVDLPAERPTDDDKYGVRVDLATPELVGPALDVLCHSMGTGIPATVRFEGMTYPWFNLILRFGNECDSESTRMTIQRMFPQLHVQTRVEGDIDGHPTCWITQVAVPAISIATSIVSLVTNTGRAPFMFSVIRIG